eukprot:CAMPEP_0176486118 /NCGR_PEP_ID=MMETSP0200_2-20121128/5400_1 /TAXON_ID=947934 /ORGANISM="Chaetoceros sp., Strain GSL56" /LENGTH=148 /DNA_ID=CAMNT_0017882803 /DNA_START=380 /DNA_END=826 /DNA_ORIENTATION=+
MRNPLMILFRAFNSVTYQHERVFAVKFFDEFDAKDFLATYERVRDENIVLGKVGELPAAVQKENKPSNNNTVVMHQKEEEEEEEDYDDEEEDDKSLVFDVSRNKNINNTPDGRNCSAVEDVDDLDEFEFENTQDFPHEPFYPSPAKSL